MNKYSEISLEHHCKGISKAIDKHNCFQVEENVIPAYMISHSLRVCSKLEKVSLKKIRICDLFFSSFNLGLQWAKIKKDLHYVAIIEKF